MKNPLLLGCKGCGNVIVESAFALAGIALDCEEGEMGSPWFLGERASALDLYLAVMTRWRPGMRWFAKHTPKVVAVAKRAAALPAVAPVIERNFG